MVRAEPKPPRPADGLQADLGEDLAALVAALATGVKSITQITSLSARRSRRATFRIALEDGSAIKGRRFDSRFEAERFAKLSCHLANAQLPAAIAQRGNAVIEPWTDGTSLAGHVIAPDEACALGMLLASIHVAPPPAGSDHEFGLARTERLGRLAANSERLTDLGCIDAAFAARIRSAAGSPPAAFVIGLIHGDFFPDNFIRTSDHRIVAVDNETLRFEALDYDLARTWYRWRMSESQVQAFLDGYRTLRSPDSFIQYFCYWAICALVDAATFRADAEIAGVEPILRRLDAFIRQRPAFPGDGGDPS
jgi:Ser/Thr protein kinase RdoA (MazF antagonist)